MFSPCCCYFWIGTVGGLSEPNNSRNVYDWPWRKLLPVFWIIHPSHWCYRLTDFYFFLSPYFLNYHSIFTSVTAGSEQVEEPAAEHKLWPPQKAWGEGADWTYLWGRDQCRQDCTAHRCAGEEVIYTIMYFTHTVIYFEFVQVQIFYRSGMVKCIPQIKGVMKFIYFLNYLII